MAPGFRGIRVQSVYIAGPVTACYLPVNQPSNPTTDVFQTRAQQTRDIQLLLVQGWTSVVDAGPILSQRWSNVLCLLGIKFTKQPMSCGLKLPVPLISCTRNHKDHSHKTCHVLPAYMFKPTNLSAIDKTYRAHIDYRS